jgi:hypothetical protein
LDHVPGRHAEAEELLAQAAGERELAREDSVDALQDAREAEVDRQQDAGFEAIERSGAAEYREAAYADVEYPERAEYAEIEYPERANYADAEYAERAEILGTELAEPPKYAEAEGPQAREIVVAEAAAGIEAAKTAEPLGVGEAGSVERVEAAAQQGQMNEPLRSVQEGGVQELAQPERSIDGAKDVFATEDQKPAEGVSEQVSGQRQEVGARQVEEIAPGREEVRTENAVNQGADAQRDESRNGENQNSEKAGNRQEAENVQRNDENTPQRDAGTAEGRYQELRADEARAVGTGVGADVARELEDPLFQHAHSIDDRPIHFDQTQALHDHLTEPKDYTNPAHEFFEQTNRAQENGAQDQAALWQDGWHVPSGERDAGQAFQQAGFAATHTPDGLTDLNELAGYDASDRVSNYFVPTDATYNLGRIAPAQWPGAMASKQDPVDQTTQAIFQNHYAAQMEGADGGTKVKPANFGYSFGGSFGKMFGPGLSPSPSEEG